jgi:alpha-amylase/alpha-mannosidase (GH57 family)
VDLFKTAVRGPLLNVATDGETYGHHFKFGDLCLAHALAVEAPEAGFELTNYAEYLDRHPAEIEVRIEEGPTGEGTSWSCAHGVGRWTRDCGCHTGGSEGWNQQWRGPLRAALEFLRDQAAREFARAGSELFRDPWEARNAYIQVILDPSTRSDFLKAHARKPLSAADERRAEALLEMQRNSLLMFTSCGWFFSELSGIETVQVMKYAARVIELMNELELPSARVQFLEILREARSNLPEKGTGVDIYERLAEDRGQRENADIQPAFSEH